MDRGGSKEPLDGIIYFWTVLFPNGALGFIITDE
jgi:hypothetical protein